MIAKEFGFLTRLPAFGSLLRRPFAGLPRGLLEHRAEARENLRRGHDLALGDPGERLLPAGPQDGALGLDLASAESRETTTRLSTSDRSRSTWPDSASASSICVTVPGASCPPARRRTARRARAAR